MPGPRGEVGYKYGALLKLCSRSSSEKGLDIVALKYFNYF